MIAISTMILAAAALATATIIYTTTIARCQSQHAAAQTVRGVMQRGADLVVTQTCSIPVESESAINHIS